MSKKILVAEDESDILFMVTFSLRTMGGFEVIEACNGLEAVAKAQQEQPDLIILDIRMPRMNGYDACQKFKEVESLKDVPVIFLSAKSQRQEIEAAMSLGAADYIVKPFGPEELVAKVREVLEQE